MKKLILFLLLATTAFAQCTINQQPPIGVIAGSCVQLTASCPNPVWTLTTGSEGTVDQTGKYCTPNQVPVQSSVSGTQSLPNDAYVNRPVNNDPTHPTSTYWVNRWVNSGQSRQLRLSAGPRFYQNFYSQPADENTPVQKSHAVFFVHDQDVTWPLVLPPYTEMQDAWRMNPYGAPVNGTGPDRRSIVEQALNNGMGINYEYYQLMPDSHNTVWHTGPTTGLEFDTNFIKPEEDNPLTLNVNGVTGSCSGFNGTNKQFTLVSQTPGNGYAYHLVLSYNYNSSGCTGFTNATVAGSASNVAAANVGTMGMFRNWSNTVYRSTTAGGEPGIAATAINPNTWYSNVINNKVDPYCGHVVSSSHVAGFTLPNNMISGGNLGAATTGDEVFWGHPQMAIASCTPGNPTRCTTSYNMGTGGLDGCDNWLSVPAAPNTCSTRLRFSGFTGSWSQLNDNADHSNGYVAQASQFAFTINVDSSTWGTPVINNTFGVFDWPTYGTVWAIDPSKLNIDTICTGGTDTYCPFEKAELWRGVCYGYTLDDGGDAGNVRILSSGFEPKQIVDAGKQLTSVYFANTLRIVDPSGVLPLNYDGANQVTNNELLTTNFRRTQVCANNSCVDVNPVGTAIRINASGSEKLPLIALGMSYKPTITVTGNVNTSYTCGIESPVPGASIDPDGTIHAPATLVAAVGYKEKCWANADPTVIAYASGYFEPMYADGTIRLWWGTDPSYQLANGETFYSQVARIQYAGSGVAYESPQGTLYAPIYGTYNISPSCWTGKTDGKFYGNSISARNDVTENIVLPNGTYTLTLYGEAGAGVSAANSTAYDLEVNGHIVDTMIDPFVRAGGTCTGYSHTYQVNVVNNLLSLIARDRIDTTRAVYGFSPWSAIKLTPGQQQPSLDLTAVPAIVAVQQGQQGTSTLTVVVSGGFNNPVTLSLVGTLPAGVTATINPTTLPAPGNGSSTVTFTTTLATPVGNYPFTVKADGGGLEDTAPVTLSVSQHIDPIEITTLSLPAGNKGQGYSVQLTAQGGIGAYKWSSLAPLPMGLTLNTSGLLSGTPLVAGNFNIGVKVCDSEPTPMCATSTLPLLITDVPPLTITTDTLPNASMKHIYGAIIQASGGYGGYTFSIVSGKLPPGMTLYPTGILSGLTRLTTVQNKFTFTVQVKDSHNQTATKQFTITVIK